MSRNPKAHIPLKNERSACPRELETNQFAVTDKHVATENQEFLYKLPIHNFRFEGQKTAKLPKP